MKGLPLWRLGICFPFTVTDSYVYYCDFEIDAETAANFYGLSGYTIIYTSPASQAGS